MKVSSLDVSWFLSKNWQIWKIQNPGGSSRPKWWKNLKNNIDFCLFCMILKNSQVSFIRWIKTLFFMLGGIVDLILAKKNWVTPSGSSLTRNPVYYWVYFVKLKKERILSYYWWFHHFVLVFIIYSVKMSSINYAKYVIESNWIHKALVSAQFPKLVIDCLLPLL